MKFSVLVTVDDHALTYGTWGKVGIYHILDRMRKAGVHRIYWRALPGCGQAAYPSRITDIATHWDPENNVFMDGVVTGEMGGNEANAQVEWINASVDYGEFDQISCARDRAHQLGIEFGVWYEVRAEDGGVGEYSTFIKRYPQLLGLTRDGERAFSELSWGEPEVMERRMGIFREIINYEPDAVFFDFIKAGDYLVPRFDQEGWWCMGYEPSVAKAFQQETGINPHEIPNSDMGWLKFRARPVTEFMRKARAIQQKMFPKVEFALGAVSKGSPVFSGNLRKCVKENRSCTTTIAHPLGNLEDHPVWTGEGLFDNFCVAHNNASGKQEVGDFIRQKIKESAEDIKGKVRLAMEISTYGLGNCDGEDAPGSVYLRTAAKAAHECGATELVLRESCPLWNVPGIWERLKRLTQEFAL